jgi:glycerol dehydrogenase
MQWEEIHRVCGIIAERQTGVLIGMAGKKHRQAKIRPTDGHPVIVVPTIASTDAPCSGCAVVYATDGVYE